MPVPDWYHILDLAREWHVPPWELESAPVEWVARGLYLNRLRNSTTVTRG